MLAQSPEQTQAFAPFEGVFVGQKNNENNNNNCSTQFGRLCINDAESRAVF